MIAAQPWQLHMRAVGHSLDVGDRGREDYRATPVYQRRELLHREKRPFGVQVEHFAVDSLGDTFQRRANAEPGVDEEQVDGVELGFYLRAALPCTNSAEV